MFGTLLESRRVRIRSVGSTTMSAALHALLVVGAVYATARGSEPDEIIEETIPTYTTVRPAAESPAPVKTETPRPVSKITTVQLVQPHILNAPIEIPTSLPAIDALARITGEAEFTRRVTLSGLTGVTSDSGRAGPDASYTMADVEKVARMLPGNPEPGYPAILRQTKQTGRVVVTFVIDAAGKADMSTLRIVEASNPLFAEEVKKVLPRYRFLAAEIGGRKVRMHVQLPFLFTLTK
jgi:protein TonB